MKQTLVVIGNGMVGQHFLAEWVASLAQESYDVVTFCEEPRAAYDRVHLSEFFSGKTAEDLSLVEDVFFESEEKPKHFRYVINSDQVNESVVFVGERGQQRPADAEERKHFKIMEVV